MKRTEIIFDGYAGSWKLERVACRGIVLRDGKILLTCDRPEDRYKIPGGGMEAGESDIECCIREVSEETGYLVSVSPCVLEIDEYFGERKNVNRYFMGTVISGGEQNLTDEEKKLGTEPVWLDVSEALEIFSRYEDYKTSDSRRWALYMREYKALCGVLCDRE